jgi:hypothetical protein
LRLTCVFTRKKSAVEKKRAKHVIAAEKMREKKKKGWGVMLKGTDEECGETSREEGR